jgi:hypothetical protein
MSTLARFSAMSRGSKSASAAFSGPEKARGGGGATGGAAVGIEFMAP